MKSEELFQRVQKVLRTKLAEGQMVETGWQTFKSLNVSDPRITFFAGVKFGIEAIMYFTDDCEATTENDMRRMQSLMTELERFEEELRKLVK